MFESRIPAALSWSCSCAAPRRRGPAPLSACRPAPGRNTPEYALRRTSGSCRSNRSIGTATCGSPPACRACGSATRRSTPSAPRARAAGRRPGRGAGRVPRARTGRLHQRRPLSPGRAARRDAAGDRAGPRRPASGCRRCSSSARRCAPSRALFNAAVVIHRGRILGAVPKSYLPEYREFYEKRQFRAARDVIGAGARRSAARASRSAPTCCSAPTDVPDLTLHVEICEDVWAPIPPSTYGALAGATVLANLSASNITVGKSDYRHMLCAGAFGPHDRRLRLHGGRPRRVDHRPRLGRPGDDLRERRSAGRGRALPARGRADRRRRRPRPAGRRPRGDELLGRLDPRPSRDRLRRLRRVEFELAPAAAARSGCVREIERFPYVPVDPAPATSAARRSTGSRSAGLQTRLEATGIEKLVIGVSGGLDSTHALIVAARALDRLGLPRTNVLAYTMPGFGTSERTLQSARALMAALGVSADEIDIRPAVAADARVDRPSRRRAASRSTTSPTRTCRRASAPRTCSASPTSTARWCSAPATSPSWRSAGAPTASATRCRTTTSTPRCPRR